MPPLCPYAGLRARDQSTTFLFPLHLSQVSTRVVQRQTCRFQNFLNTHLHERARITSHFTTPASLSTCLRRRFTILLRARARLSSLQLRLLLLHHRELFEPSPHNTTSLHSVLQKLG
jgi:hypothetical protein